VKSGQKEIKYLYFCHETPTLESGSILIMAVQASIARGLVGEQNNQLSSRNAIQTLLMLLHHS
jgi:hypothetical protein